MKAKLKEWSPLLIGPGTLLRELNGLDKLLKTYVPEDVWQHHRVMSQRLAATSVLWAAVVIGVYAAGVKLAEFLWGSLG